MIEKARVDEETLEIPAFVNGGAADAEEIPRPPRRPRRRIRRYQKIGERRNLKVAGVGVAALAAGVAAVLTVASSMAIGFGLFAAACALMALTFALDDFLP